MTSYMPQLPSRTARAYSAIAACIDWVYEAMMRFVLGVISNLYDASIEPPVSIPEPVTQISRFDDVSLNAVPVVTPVADVSTHMITEGMTLFVQDPRVSVYRTMSDDFDGRIGYLHYGEYGTVRAIHGERILLEAERLFGWVPLRACTEYETVSCFPLATGVAYDAQHPCTRFVRTVLGDPFGLLETAHPLTGAEYVLYQWYEMGKEIVWPSTRPRTPGTWHQILRTSPTTHITLEPVMGSIMEYVDATGKGHLAYVRDVTESTTLSLEEVGEESDGVYTVRELTRDAWNKRSPLFITNAMFDTVL